MHSLDQLGATLLMGLFALGVIGCAITIPICAFKFFAILFERTEEQAQAAYGVMPVYQTLEPVPAAQPAEAEVTNEAPSRPRARGAAAGK